MKNCVIFKGKNSNEIEGLLISELPSISKPEMRVETTIIDGRDGDIQENIGYSSYDKTLKISLVKGFDINKVIKYFSGSGDIIFSNEPDKVYKASITKQIDYERLLIFKTANIKINVQPYKYLLNEESTILDINSETQLEVNNVGLEISKPTLNLYGNGIIEISINGLAIFQINIDDGYVVIDSEKQDAYKDSILKNTKMNGEFPLLEPGLNIITWTGNLTKIEVKPNSRWL